MYKYHLFIINNNAYKIYKNNSKYLYEILNTLYYLKGKDLIYGINLYNNICDLFSVKLLNNYLCDKFSIKHINNYMILTNKIEYTKIKLNYSNVVIISNKKIPNLLKIFNIYNHKIFVINYNNKEYFWLDEKLNRNNI